MKYLLHEHKELEKLVIRFSSSEELNDPMEGYKDVCGTRRWA